jgi:hypothetical protein
MVAEPDAWRLREIAVSPGWSPCARPTTEGSIECTGALQLQLFLHISALSLKARSRVCREATRAWLEKGCRQC